MDFLTQHFTSILVELNSRGYKLPYFFSVISSNGCILGGKYEYDKITEQLNCKFLAEHIEHVTFDLPINIMFVDKANNAIRVFIDESN
jgi:hypothetical protein